METLSPEAKHRWELRMFLFLTVVDLLLTKVMGSFWGGG